MTDFASLGVADPLCRALVASNYTQPTPIQTRAIPALLAGKDLLGIAQTGTGKTAAFAVPMLQRLAADRVHLNPREVRSLILAPTRELAVQISDNIRAYARNLKLRTAIVLGGVKINPQIAALKPGVDVLIATPGRLLDLVQQNHVRLDKVSILVIDEADRMFDMGFIRDIRRIVGLTPRSRQSMLFSATMPQEVVALTADMLKSPERIEVAPQATPAELIRQEVHFVPTAQKRDKLTEILKNPEVTRVIVFSRTKHGANRIALQLEKAGLKALALHGNKSQAQRQRALGDFRSGAAPILVATDIAARGIDVTGISHVINFDLPNVPEDYVHRIGRTARAGASGIAISLCDSSERGLLRDIERKMRVKIDVVGFEPKDEPYAATASREPARDFQPKKRRFNARRGRPQSRQAA
jgi:ATP-dependent RNA helicase RhlE